MRLQQVVRIGRRAVLGAGALALAVGALAAVPGTGGADDRRADWGAVYTLTNDPDGNELAAFPLDAKGRLGKPVFYPTCGDGTGGGLGNQGALALSADGNFLYAVNAGSDNVSVFRLTRNGPQVIQVIDAGGKRPVSVAVQKNRLYVLNAGGAAGDADNVVGFEVRGNGRLRALEGAKHALSAANTAPAQVAFAPDGSALVVTEKATDTITLIALDRRGLPADAAAVPSVGRTPFGFEFSRDGFLVVSEAFGGAADASAVSSYWLDGDEGALEPLSKSVPTTETAACWIAITRNGEYAYTTNTGSDSITGYKLGRKGKLARLTDDGVTAETGNAPTDLAVVGNRALFVLNRDDGSIGSYAIGAGGALKAVEVAGGLDGAFRPTGLIVR